MAVIETSTEIEMIKYKDAPRALGKNIWDSIKIPPSQLRSQYVWYHFNETTGNCIGIVGIKKGVTNAYNLADGGVQLST